MINPEIIKVKLNILRDNLEQIKEIDVEKMLKDIRENIHQYDEYMGFIIARYKLSWNMYEYLIGTCIIGGGVWAPIYEYEHRCVPK